MKYCVMSVALPCAPNLFCRRSGQWGKLLCWDGRGGNLRNDCLRMQPLPALQVKDAWTTILALAAVAGTLVVVGKIGADIAQRQARG